MKGINTSYFDFPSFIQKGCVYVDKTARIYDIARPDTESIYFLARPRHVGKSLTISTLKALFQGRCELFKSLAIERWKYMTVRYAF